MPAIKFISPLTSRKTQIYINGLSLALNQYYLFMNLDIMKKSLCNTTEALYYKNSGIKY